MAIGREGQNARLAARLTSWKIDVKSYSNAVKLGIIEGENNEETEEKSLEDLLADIETILKSCFFGVISRQLKHILIGIFFVDIFHLLVFKNSFDIRKQIFK